MTIARHCNGGPHGDGRCGVTATHVARDEHGLEWFCCQAHTEGAGQRASTRLVALADWYLMTTGRCPRCGAEAVPHPVRLHRLVCLRSLILGPETCTPPLAVARAELLRLLLQRPIVGEFLPAADDPHLRRTTMKRLSRTQNHTQLITQLSQEPEPFAPHVLLMPELPGHRGPESDVVLGAGLTLEAARRDAAAEVGSGKLDLTKCRPQPCTTRYAQLVRVHGQPDALHLDPGGRWAWPDEGPWTPAAGSTARSP